MQKDRIDLLQAVLADVEEALERLGPDCTSADRRNCLRTVVSAAEAVSWVYRDHILAVAKDLDRATPLIEFAFAEASFAVSERGEIIEQARYIPLTAMIRLITRVAQSYCPDLDVDFGTSGWQSLKDTIQVRNRITHPKNIDDLTITNAEIETAKAGFFWLLDMSMQVMEEAVKELRLHFVMTKKMVDDLISGDPDTLALYHRVHREQA